MPFPNPLALLDASVILREHPIYSFEDQVRAGEAITDLHRKLVRERLEKDGFTWVNEGGYAHYRPPRTVADAFLGAEGKSLTYDPLQEDAILATGARIWVWAWENSLVPDAAGV